MIVFTVELYRTMTATGSLDIPPIGLTWLCLMLRQLEFQSAMLCLSISQQQWNVFLEI